MAPKNLELGQTQFIDVKLNGCCMVSLDEGGPLVIEASSYRLGMGERHGILFRVVLPIRFTPLP